MISSRPLTALAEAQAALLAMLAPVAPQPVACADAIGLVAADLAPLAAPLPPRAHALRAGYALCAQELAGASAFTPAFPATAPQAVALGEALPEGCNCVLEPAALDFSGPMAQALADAYPGENVRRAGEDFPAGAVILAPGRKITARDALVAASAGFATLPVRRPRVSILGDDDSTAVFIAQLVRASGAQLGERAGADLVLVFGDPPAQAHVLAQGFALEPGRDCALGRLDETPMIMLPLCPAQAFAGFVALVRPALERLCASAPAAALSLPLAAKISSRVGVAELALLRAEGGYFTPLAIGDCPLQALSCATHVALIGAASEGHAPGEIFAADPLEA